MSMLPSVEPLAATVSRWNELDSVGTLRLDDGRALRFGRTACHGFVPREGMRVFVAAVGPHPLGGERALSVRDEPISDEAAARRAGAESDRARRQALEPVEAIANAMAPMALDDGYAPTTDEIEELLLPRTCALLASIRAQDHDFGELAWDRPPWSFYDPCLRAFGADGAGNVYALHVYPPRLLEGIPAPVVFWDHEQHEHVFRAESLEAFIGMLLHEAMEDEDRRSWRAPELGVEPRPPTDDWMRWDAPDELVWPIPRRAASEEPVLADELCTERSLARALVDSTLDDERVPERFRALDGAYRELGWDAHRRCLHHQGHDWLGQRRREAEWALERRSKR